MQFMLSDRWYKFFKHLVQVILPAAGTLYFTLSQTWGWEYGEEVVGTLAAVALFIGLVVGVSARTYDKTGQAFDGSMDLEMDPGGIKRYNLNLDSPPEVLETMDRVTFKVNRTPVHPASQQ